jgi:hypothetical protein
MTPPPAAAQRMAESILAAYRQALEAQDFHPWGMDAACLPCEPARIKQAIITLLRGLEPGDDDFRESLLLSYVQLAAFIPAEEVAIAKAGHDAIVSGDVHHPGMPHAEQALRTISRIKLGMEALAEEVRQWLAEGQP